MIEVQNVNKFYNGPHRVPALQEVSVLVKAGESLAICGPSGAGKSTLLNIMSGLDQPDSGTVTLFGRSLNQMSHDELCALRNQSMGFVFQAHHLLLDFTIEENIALPLMIRGQSLEECRPAVQSLLDELGLKGVEKRFPQELSGGEQQRVALARAIIHKPKIIFADEPTGNLDHKSGERVFDLLCRLNRGLGATLIVVTHDRDLSKKLNQTLYLESGRVL